MLNSLTVVIILLCVCVCVCCILKLHKIFKKYYFITIRTIYNYIEIHAGKLGKHKI